MQPQGFVFKSHVECNLISITIFTYINLVANIFMFSKTYILNWRNCPTTVLHISIAFLQVFESNVWDGTIKLYSISQLTIFIRYKSNEIATRSRSFIKIQINIVSLNIYCIIFSYNIWLWLKEVNYLKCLLLSLFLGHSTMDSFSLRSFRTTVSRSGLGRCDDVHAPSRTEKVDYDWTSVTSGGALRFGYDKNEITN